MSISYWYRSLMHHLAVVIIVPLAAAYPNHVWASDFVDDYALDGSTLRILTVMDEFTRGGSCLDRASI